MQTKTINHFRTGGQTVLVEGGPAHVWYDGLDGPYIETIRGGRVIEFRRRDVQGEPGDRFVMHGDERIPVKGW